MKINVDLQLLLYLMGYSNPVIYSLWSMILERKTEEERTDFIENAIKLLLCGDASLVEEVDEE